MTDCDCRSFCVTQAVDGGEPGRVEAPAFDAEAVERSAKADRRTEACRAPP